MSLDRLQKAIRKTKTPLIVSLEISGPPRDLLETSGGPFDALFTTFRALLNDLEDTIPAVSLPFSPFEALGWKGLKILEEIVQYAETKDYYVLIDTKWCCDAADAQALAESSIFRAADAVTLCGYLGSDGLKPFVKVAETGDKSMFLVVKTENPSAGEIQDLVAGDRQVCTAVADLCKRLEPAEKVPKTMGIMAKTTYPAQLKELRRRLDDRFFLLSDSAPRELAPAFDRMGWGAAVMTPLPVTAWCGAEGGPEARKAACHKALEDWKDGLKQFVTIV